MAPMALKVVVWLFPTARPMATMTGTNTAEAHRPAHHAQARIVYAQSVDDRLRPSSDPATFRGGRPTRLPGLLDDWFHGLRQ